MKQKIFFYHKNLKIEVKSKSLETLYIFKPNNKEIIQLLIPFHDSEIARKTVCKQIDKLSLN